MISEVDLMKSLEYAEDNFKAEHIDEISAGEESPFTGGVLSAIYDFKTMIEEQPKIDILGTILKKFDVRTQYELPDDARTTYRVVKAVLDKGE